MDGSIVGKMMLYASDLLTKCNYLVCLQSGYY